MNFLHLFPEFKIYTLCYKTCYTTEDYDNKNSKQFFSKLHTYSHEHYNKFFGLILISSLLDLLIGK